MTWLAPHHDGSPAFVGTPRGHAVLAPELGDEVTLTVDVPHAAGLQRVHVRTVIDGEPEHRAAERIHRGRGADRYAVSIPMVNPTQRYRFELNGPGGAGWLTQQGWCEHDVADATDFALVAGPPPPRWVPDAVFYQILPDRFSRSGASDRWPDWSRPARWSDPVAIEGREAMEQLYGGDLPGILDRLPHLRDLGVDAVYLTPVFPASENHRYCATSFDEVDPFLGGDEALAELAAGLRDDGIRLIGDLTLNHSGDQHPWFVAGRADARAEEAGFYHFIDHPDRYHAWAGVPTLPKFDHRDAGLRRRLYAGEGSVADRYLRAPFHLDGWRIDAANMAGRCGAVDVAHEVARCLRRTVDAAGEDRYLVAEHAHDASKDLQGGGWHGTMDYLGFSRQAWSWLADHGRDVSLFGPGPPVPPRDASGVATSIRTLRAHLPWTSVVHSLTLLGSHDTPRWASVSGDLERRHVGLAWQFTFPGVPSVFAGDELGLEGDSVGEARRPMPWDDPDRWDRRTLELTRRLIRLRRSSVALRHGGLRWLVAAGDTLVYLREHPEERMLVQLTRAAHPTVTLDAVGLDIDASDWRSERGLRPELDHDGLAVDDGVLTLPPAPAPVARVWRLPPRPAAS